jgi:tRNA(His) 5'-end guanylyltransferase
MSSNLKARIDAYQAATDYKLLNRVPIIVVINGRSFSKVTQLLDKPYDTKFAECLNSTMMRLCTDVEGSLFGYQHNDEIVLVTRNDQSADTSPWYDNRLQKICSVTSAIATIHFNECATSLQLNMVGSPIFTSHVFMTPTIGEAINTFVSKQQQNFHTSIQSACLYNLLNRYDKNSIKEMLTGLNLEDKIDLLKQECNINYNDYPISFRRGTAVYKVPKIIKGDITKNKWHINYELPIFTKDQSFLSNLFKNNGVDILRQESLNE